MRIDGSSYSLAELWRQTQSGTDGSDGSIQAVLPGASGSTAETFAAEIGRRITGNETGSDPSGKDASGLLSALSDTVDWIEGRFGSDAATAAQAMVMGSTGSGADEDNLSQGLVSVLAYIDRNFGTAAGDEAIAQFNGRLNTELNDYFDNGKTEQFLAVSGGAGQDLTGQLDAAATLGAVAQAQAQEGDGAGGSGDAAKTLVETLLAKVNDEPDPTPDLEFDPAALAQEAVQQAEPAQDDTADTLTATDLTAQSRRAAQAYGGNAAYATAPAGPQWLDTAV